MDVLSTGITILHIVHIEIFFCEHFQHLTQNQCAHFAYGYIISKSRYSKIIVGYIE